MSITLTTNYVSGAGFVNNGYSADWSGCETIVAAVSDKSIYIEKIYIISETTETFTFGAGETAGSVTATVLGPIYSPGYIILPLEFTRPLKITASTALTVDAAGATAATIIVQGYIR